MILLNWAPEIIILGTLFLGLLFYSFRYFTHPAITLVVPAGSGLGLSFCVLRSDVLFYPSVSPVLFSDGLSAFGKLLGLLIIFIFSLGTHFNHHMSTRQKQGVSIASILLGLFIVILFQTNHILMFAACVLGVAFSSQTLISLEAGRSDSWMRWFRNRSWSMLGAMVALSLMFFIGTVIYQGVTISEWVLKVAEASHDGGGREMGFLVILISNLFFSSLLVRGAAPFGIAAHAIGVYLLAAVFWMRWGVPFFAGSGLLDATWARHVLSGMMMFWVLKYGYAAVRARDHDLWIGCSLPLMIMVLMFVVLLPAETAISVFMISSVSFIFSVLLLSMAFLEKEYRQKMVLFVALLFFTGAPPFILGDQIFYLINHLVQADNLFAGSAVIFGWFLVIVSVVQKLGDIISVRNGSERYRKITMGEGVYGALCLMGVIALTAFRSDLISLINHHASLKLW